MNIREKITVLTNVRNALSSKIVPVTNELLSRLETYGVNLNGYRNNLGNVPIKEENKIVDMPKQYTFTTNDKKNAA